MSSSDPAALLALAENLVKRYDFFDEKLSLGYAVEYQELLVGLRALAAPQEPDPRLSVKHQQTAKELADIYGIWDRERIELHILSALHRAAPQETPQGELVKAKEVGRGEGMKRAAVAACGLRDWLRSHPRADAVSAVDALADTFLREFAELTAAPQARETT